MWNAFITWVNTPWGCGICFSCLLLLLGITNYKLKQSCDADELRRIQQDIYNEEVKSKKSFTIESKLNFIEVGNGSEK